MASSRGATMTAARRPGRSRPRHRRNKRSKKKLRKQQNLLTEVIVPKQNLLSELDIDNEIVVVDGGDDGNPSIRPTDAHYLRKNQSSTVRE